MLVAVIKQIVQRVVVSVKKRGIQAKLAVSAMRKAATQYCCNCWELSILSETLCFTMSVFICSMVGLSGAKT